MGAEKINAISCVDFEFGFYESSVEYYAEVNMEKNLS